MPKWKKITPTILALTLCSCAGTATPSTTPRASSASPSSDSASSSRPVQQKHKVEVDPVEGSTASFDQANGEYAAGAIVILTISISDPTLEFNSFLRTPFDVQLTPSEDGATITASFEMPAADTILFYSLKKKTHALNPVQSLVQAGSYYSVGDIEMDGAGSQIEVGTKVKVTANLINSVYDNDLSLFSLEVAGRSYSPVFADPSARNALIFYFDMPNEDASPILSYSSAFLSPDNGYSVTITLGDGLTAYGYNPEAKYGSFAVTLKRKSGTEITEITAQKEGESEATDIGFNNLSFDVANDIVYFTNYYLSANTALTFETKDAGTHSITLENAEHVVTSNGDPISVPETATVGDIIGIYYGADTGYRINDKATITGIPEGDTSLANWSGYICFKMPDSDVNIAFDVLQNGALTAAESDGVSSVRFATVWFGNESITSAAPNTTIYVFPTASDGKLIDSMSAATGDGTTLTVNDSSYASNGYFTFTMPAEGGVTVSFLTQDGYSVSVNDAFTSDLGSVSGIKPLYRAGAQVSLTITPTAWYTIDGAAAKDASGNAISDSNFSSGILTFTMPAGNASIDVSATAKAKANITVNSADVEGLTSFSIVGASSGATLNAAGTAAFLSGEKLTITANFDHSKSIALNATPASTGTAGAAQATSTKPTSATFSFTPSEDTTLQFASSDKAKANVTINAAGALPTFEVNGTAGLGSLYVGDELKINLPTDKVGYAYKAKVTDKDGAEVTANDGIYLVPGDITITITEEISSTVTFSGTVTNENLTITYVIHGESKTITIEGDEYSGTPFSIEADAGSTITLKSQWGDHYSMNGGASTYVNGNKEFTIIADADITFTIGSPSED